MRITHFGVFMIMFAALAFYGSVLGLLELVAAAVMGAVLHRLTSRGNVLEAYGTTTFALMASVFAGVTLGSVPFWGLILGKSLLGWRGLALAFLPGAALLGAYAACTAWACARALARNRNMMTA